MKRIWILGFLNLLICDTLSQVCSKYAAMSALPFEWHTDWLVRVGTSPWIYGALLCYVCAFVTWMTILKHVAVGPSFAASHLELVSVTLLSVWLFNEPLNAYKVVGGLLILLGVLCLAKSEQDEAKREAA